MLGYLMKCFKKAPNNGLAKCQGTREKDEVVVNLSEALVLILIMQAYNLMNLHFFARFCCIMTERPIVAYVP